MTEQTAKAVTNLGYHAHIYYDPTRTAPLPKGCARRSGRSARSRSRPSATRRAGRTRANVLVIFKPDQFAQVVPYLMVHRAGLDVLVHPLTEDGGGGPHGFRAVAWPAGRPEH